MPIKRTRVGRPQKPHITPETVDLFIRSVELQPIYAACVSDDVCRSTEPNRHCPECREYLNATSKLSEMLGLEPWHVCVEHIDTAEPPPGTDAMRVKAWHRVWQLRCALEAEVAKRKGTA